ncbi:MAG: DUF1799 domain-containing protein [Proteobacteria bacterium]|nr:DUF1799 domain-containing protein [Pseudomonadota bacterium]
MPPVEVWPDNMQAVRVFSDMATQWEVGMAGVIGLRYQALESVLRLSRVARSDWPAVFDDVRVMERVALRYFRQQQELQDKQPK